MGGAVSDFVDSATDIVSDAGDSVGDLVGGVGDTIKNNAGLIGTGVGAYFGMPALGSMVGGAIQGNSGGSGGRVGGSGGGGGGGNNPFPWLQTGFALQDMYGKQQAAKALQERFDTVNNQINGMYAPGSPEAKLMEQEMARKDAAAGRNSQYGTRAVDLAGKIAATKGNLLSQTLGNQNNMLAASLATGNSAYGSLANMFGQNFGNNNAIGSAIGQGASGLKDMFGTGGNQFEKDINTYGFGNGDQFESDINMSGFGDGNQFDFGNFNFSDLNKWMG